MTAAAAAVAAKDDSGSAVTALCNGGRVGEGGGYSDSGGGVGTAPALQPWRME